MKKLPVKLDSSDGAIQCPICGSDYTHQGKVEAFERGEDQQDCNHVQVLNNDISVDRDGKKNPSPRRQGVSIHMTCERDNHPFILDVYQHKGQTYIETRF